MASKVDISANDQCKCFKAFAKGFPSFAELRANHNNMNQPLAPVLSGSVSEDSVRYAVCRACYCETSEVIQLREIQITRSPALKAIVMPLWSKDLDDEMFCIFTSRPYDRSLHGLEVLYPYKIAHEGESLTSTIELLTPRNRSLVKTEYHARKALGLITTLPLVPIPTPPSTLPKISRPKIRAPIATSEMTKTRLRSGRQRSASGGFIDPNGTAQDLPRNKSRENSSSRGGQKRKASNVAQEDMPQTVHRNSRTQVPTPVSRQASHPTVEASVGDNRATAESALSEDLAKRVHLTWIVTAEDVEYDFSFTMYECPSLSKYLDLVRIYAADDHKVIEKVDESRMWRLTYQVPDNPVKAFTVRIEDNSQNLGYERLARSLAQSTFWKDDSSGRIDVYLRILA